MQRTFNGKTIEILAPCGNFEVFKRVIESPCDAVYLGGKDFNMRMLRPGYNFSNEEIKQCIDIANALGKKVYITINNLLDTKDIEIVKDYLMFLEQVKPHAIIIQDVAILKLVKDLKLTLPIHGSVMLNAHNKDTLKLLQEEGIKRIVLSQKIPLHEVKWIKSQVDMEIEYFIHGKAHGAICYYSSMLFGLSGNRGKCLMPCKWDYEISKDGKRYKVNNALRVSEANMFRQIPELIDAGITSFKIEGRMKDVESILKLVETISQAIERYLHNPLNYDHELGASFMDEETLKDFTHGKKFSEPKEEPKSTSERIKVIKDCLCDQLTDKNPSIPTLAVRVNNIEAARLCVSKNVETIYLSGEVYEPDKPFDVEAIRTLTQEKKQSKIYLALPRLMNDRSIEKYKHLLTHHDLGIDGLLVTNLGAIEAFRELDLELIGDTSLNILNPIAGAFYHEKGLNRISISLEAPLHAMADILRFKNYPVEVVVHGLPVNMYIDHDLLSKLEGLEGIPETTNRPQSRILRVCSSKGEYPVYKDQYGKYHKVGSKELNLMPILNELCLAEVASIRIEAAAYHTQELETIITSYQKAISLQCNKSIYNQMVSFRSGYTLGTLSFD